MANNRKLAHGEKYGSLFSSEKGRDRADARRQIESLNLADQQLAAAGNQAALLAENNALLRYVGERLQHVEQMFLDFMNVYMAEHATEPEPPAPPGQYPPPPGP